MEMGHEVGNVGTGRATVAGEGGGGGGGGLSPCFVRFLYRMRWPHSLHRITSWIEMVFSAPQSEGKRARRSGSAAGGRAGGRTTMWGPGKLATGNPGFARKENCSSTTEGRCLATHCHRCISRGRCQPAASWHWRTGEGLCCPLPAASRRVRRLARLLARCCF